MKIEIDCTWKEGKKKAKVTIHFDYRPKSLFAAPEEDLKKLHSLLKMDQTKKPSDLRPIREMAEKYPKSPYMLLHYHNALQVFERFTTAEKILETMQEKFPEEIFTKCLVAEKFLKEENYEDFKKVLKTMKYYAVLFQRDEATTLKRLCAFTIFGDTTTIKQEMKSRQTNMASFFSLLLILQKTF